MHLTFSGAYVQTAKRRAQENEAWRSVKKNAASVLEHLEHVESVSLKDLLLQSSYDTTHERWITLQFLVSLSFLKSRAQVSSTGA